jgi:signal transduction histidine kinase
MSGADAAASDSVLRAAYEAERRARCLAASAPSCLLAMGLFGAYGLSDWLMFRERLVLLLPLRLVFVAVLAIFLLLQRRFAGYWERHAIGFGILIMTAMGLMIDGVVLVTGGAASPYYAGNLCIQVGAAVLMPWPPACVLLASAIMIALYVVLALPSLAGHAHVFLFQLSFLVSIGIISVIGSTISERLRWREFCSRDGLARALEYKAAFLASVSHDLRTPLNVVIGYGQLLAEGEFGAVSAGQADVLNRIMRSAETQLGLVNDLLDLARIEQGKLSCERQDVAVADLVPGLGEVLHVLVRGRPVTFDVDVAPDTVVVADPHRLQQVLVNLLTNAAKFTERGSVRLTAQRDGGMVRVAVIDTGIGMEPALCRRATDPFVRGHGSEAGFGLGLAIVQRLVDLLGGELAITSAVGRGTRVEVRLPAAASPRRAEMAQPVRRMRERAAG